MSTRPGESRPERSRLSPEDGEGHVAADVEICPPAPPSDVPAATA